MDFSIPCNKFASLTGYLSIGECCRVGFKEMLGFKSSISIFVVSLLCLADVIVTFEVSAFAWVLFEMAVGMVASSAAASF